ncbi:DUF1684 domain-containing protein [Mesonia maritima]|uniref:DUF1684 domain-containing protein n=1 Tax=Mesonia maritima TaxID=1793873 RepID=A0ABU1K4Q9_9FLAO|nr:DUF1684 domain-containing protein [Mesonia maritima]MDR6300586.1 hypothetical protein [Mesonia maritima]
MKYLFLGIILFSLQLKAQTLNKSSLIAESKLHQEKLNKDFLNEEESPLSEKDRAVFKGLDFFPINEKYIVQAKFIRTPYESPFTMATSTDRKSIYLKYGELSFKIDGKIFSLNVYQNQRLLSDPEYKDYLFIPFTDLTNGNETYEVGRYLDFSIPKSNTVILDFNKAYNPYCAYSGNYSCPIPPEENHLEIEIKAGVKKYYSPSSKEKKIN